METQKPIDENLKNVLIAFLQMDKMLYLDWLKRQLEEFESEKK
jgi:hypothetical protein